MILWPKLSPTYLNIIWFLVHSTAFLAKKSMCTNLLECLCDWSGNLEKHAARLVAYIDFSKAFDSVSLPKLMHKLSSYGLAGNLLSCIKVFLTNRFQRVRVGSNFSVEKTVLSDVPQGSMLGPILFILFVNNISNFIGNTSNVKLFADDLKKLQ